ncbi:MAG: glutamate-1-semialdehyde 2,1-aminomutase [Cyclobacteriaceae bacterium]|nr:glutamate-1-semialdehyde 2,1-aminomutase [Cyclobacteriaceae bacterium]
MNTTKSQELYKRGQRHMVGAVNSPVRAFQSVGGTPIFIDHGQGAYVTDVDGNTYVDLVQSYGPMILGHGHPKVLEAVSQAITKGFSFGASTEAEVELAEIICDAFPGMDMVRLVNSGTEAVFSAIRLARAFKGKNKIIKFDGCYHGHADSLLVAAGSGVATLSLPGSSGVPEEAVKNTLIATYNSLDSVKQHIAANEDIAAVIIEPIAGNMGVVLPQDNFLKDLKILCEQHNILLIIDEVMTGFRSTFGGAQEVLGVEADITCLGKVIGGGFPVGAYGARREIMEMVAPLGPMYQAGTLSGNPIAVASGIATLKALRGTNPYQLFNELGKNISNTLLEEARKNKIDLTVNRFGAMLNPFFNANEINNFDDAKQCNTDQFAKFFWLMMEEGVFIPPSQYEAWFLSIAIGSTELDKLKIAISNSFKKLTNP